MVTGCGGHVAVFSEEGMGTSFHVYLPASAGTPSPVTANPIPPPVGGSETVLLVEDDPALRLAMNVWQGDQLLYATPGEPGVVQTTQRGHLERLQVGGKAWRSQG